MVGSLQLLCQLGLAAKLTEWGREMGSEWQARPFFGRCEATRFIALDFIDLSRGRGNHFKFNKRIPKNGMRLGFIITFIRFKNIGNEGLGIQVD